MEPQIRYAPRTDGARTAYAVLGQGPVLIYPPGFTSHLEWGFNFHAGPPRFRDGLAGCRTLVYYDRHGCGLSDRRRTDFTPEDDMRDIEAVIAATGATKVDILGISFGGLAAVRYAAEHPERVRRLILWGTSATNVLPPAMQARAQALRDLRRSDRELATRTVANQLFPSGVDPETFRLLVKVTNEAATAEMAEQLESVRFDNRDYLARVAAPALVMHRRSDEMVPFAAGQYLARKLPNARFIPLEGDEHLPNFGDVDAALQPMLDFLAEDDVPVLSGDRVSPHPAASGTAIVLFTDIADSTAITERMGDAAFRAASRALDTAVRAAMRDCGGTPVEGKVLGDGVMGVFTSAAQAIDAARRCVELSGESELRLHIGLHAGDVIREEGNVYGGAVNIASRVCGLSEPGEILVSGTIRDLARTSAGATFEDRGEHALKGIDDPVRVFAISEHGSVTARHVLESADPLARLRREEVKIRIQREDLVRDGVWAIVQYATELAGGLCPKELGSKWAWHGSIKWDELQTFCRRLRILGLVDVQTREHKFKNGESELWETFYLNDEGARVVRAITSAQHTKND